MANLSEFGTCTRDDDGCTTCGDIGVPVHVITLRPCGFAECKDHIGRRAESPRLSRPRPRPATCSSSTRALRSLR